MKRNSPSNTPGSSSNPSEKQGVANGHQSSGRNSVFGPVGLVLQGLAVVSALCALASAIFLPWRTLSGWHFVSGTQLFNISPLMLSLLIALAIISLFLTPLCQRSVKATIAEMLVGVSIVAACLIVWQLPSANIVIANSLHHQPGMVLSFLAGLGICLAASIMAVLHYLKLRPRSKSKAGNPNNSSELSPSIRSIESGT